MGGVLIGFAIIAAVIGVGYLIARIGLLGANLTADLSRLAFFVLTPALLFTVLAEADAGRLFSELLPISAIAAVTQFVVFAAIALAVWRRPVPETTIGALSAGYINSNNIGLPVSLYVLGDATVAVPILLLQVVVIAPIALSILDATTSGKVSLGRVLLQPVRNPLIIASALGLTVSLTGLELPAPVLAPFELIGAAAVPVILIAFGMSLHGRRPLAPGPERKDVIVASILKLAAMPLVAWVLGYFVWGLTGHTLFAVVVLAALPTAQNIFTFAQRYTRGVVIARDTILVTTALSIVSLVAIAALLAPG
jgi:malonate transporter